MPYELKSIMCAVCANCANLELRLGHHVSLFRVDVVGQTDHQVLSAFEWQTKTLILVGVYVLFAHLHSYQFIININCMWPRFYPTLFLISVIATTLILFMFIGCTYIDMSKEIVLLLSSCMILPLFYIRVSFRLLTIDPGWFGLFQSSCSSVKPLPVPNIQSLLILVLFIVIS